MLRFLVPVNRQWDYEIVELPRQFATPNPTRIRDHNFVDRQESHYQLLDSDCAGQILADRNEFRFVEWHHRIDRSPFENQEIHLKDIVIIRR